MKEFNFSCISKNGQIDLFAAPPIILNVWDHDDDITDSTDDLIGRAIINLSEAAHSGEDSDV